MSVSVIICTLNRAHLLERMLHSLLHQSLRPDCFEILVVDDGSQDETPSVCHRFRQKLPDFKYIPIQQNLGLAHARNVGTQEALGEKVLFTDDDCIAEKRWVERLSLALDREPIVAGAVASPTTNCIKLCHNIAQFHSFMPGRKRKTLQFIAGANMGFRRSVLDELGGFTASFRIAQDMELILRARLKGYGVHFVPDAVVMHDPSRTRFKDIAHHISEHARTTILLRKQYHVLLNTPFVLRSSPLLLLFAPLIALKVTWDIYSHNLSLARRFWTMPLVYALKLAWCWGAVQGLQRQEKAGQKGENPFL